MNEVTVGGLITALLLSIAVTGMAYAKGFFVLKPSPPVHMPLKYLLGAFLTYLLSQLVLLPLIYFGFAYFFLGLSVSELKNFKAHLSQEQLITITLFSFVFIALALAIYCSRLKRPILSQMLGKGPFWKNIGFGAMTLLISFPTVLFVNNATNLLTKILFGVSGVEQSTVKQLKELVHSPILFAFMALVVSTLVPFVEELLFRGFLQNYLKNKFGFTWALILTSILFSLAHFSLSQGIGNLELIASLLVLSFYLGFIYERQKSLYAPFALHMCFNASTVVGILLGR